MNQIDTQLVKLCRRLAAELCSQTDLRQHLTPDLHAALTNVLDDFAIAALKLVLESTRARHRLAELAEVNAGGARPVHLGLARGH